MAWLVCEAHVLASAEIASTRAERRKGLIGRRHVEGAFVLRPCRAVHSIGMKFPIDVAFLDGDGLVLKTQRMQPHRIGLPVRRARLAIEAEAGAFDRWGLCVGDIVEVREDQPNS